MRTYARPSIGWIKRRARRLMRAFGISRRMAIADATTDYCAFTHQGAH
jgi:hypothetical protein